jgi:hypothetical protein
LTQRGSAIAFLPAQRGRQEAIIVCLRPMIMHRGDDRQEKMTATSGTMLPANQQERVIYMKQPKLVQLLLPDPILRGHPSDFCKHSTDEHHIAQNQMER